MSEAWGICALCIQAENTLVSFHMRIETYPNQLSSGYSLAFPSALGTRAAAWAAERVVRTAAIVTVKRIVAEDKGRILSVCVNGFCWRVG
jgi:hypothetical protein